MGKNLSSLKRHFKVESGEKFIRGREVLPYIMEY